MTQEEIYRIFPPGLGGNAQISDLRQILYHINDIGDLNGIEFYEVQTISDRNNLDADKGDICKVFNVGGNTITYILSNTGWKVLVEGTGGGGPGPSMNQVTENFTVGSLDEQMQEIALMDTPNLSAHLFVFLNGMYLMLGSNYDYTISNNTIQFHSAHITAGDNLAVKYSI